MGFLENCISAHISENYSGKPINDDSIGQLEDEFNELLNCKIVNYQGKAIISTEKNKIYIRLINKNGTEEIIYKYE